MKIWGVTGSFTWKHLFEWAEVWACYYHIFDLEILPSLFCTQAGTTGRPIYFPNALPLQPAFMAVLSKDAILDCVSKSLLQFVDLKLLL